MIRSILSSFARSFGRTLGRTAARRLSWLAIPLLILVVIIALAEASGGGQVLSHIPAMPVTLTGVLRASR